MSESTAPRLNELSNELAALVASSSQHLVAVQLGGGRSVSGIVWRPGYVVTAAERLDDEPTSLRVVWGTAGESEAQLLGRDLSTDVAVLSVAALTGEGLSGQHLPTVRAGQLALAVGHSAEHGPIVTFGSIAVAGGAWQSRLGGRIDRLLRVSASLSPAAEGGAVLDLEGSLIGMAILGPRRAFLAIPADTIGRVVEQLVAKGRISRGYLGIAMQPVRLPEALQKLANTGVGLLVSSVDPQSGAALGGMLLGDVIVGWNGEPVRDYRQVQRSLAPESVGSSLTVTAVRAGALITLRLTVGERPSSG
jgi:S1-C subfamily serine protease